MSEYQQPSYSQRTTSGFNQRSVGKDFKLGMDAKSGNPFSLTQSDRENHTHIIGSTGTGKSKFLELLLRQDVKNRRAGLCLIDPHGSLYDEVLLHCSHRNSTLSDRFILFNPAGEDQSILGFNPVHPDSENLDYLLESLIAACLKAWGQDDTDRTPRITKWLGNIFHTLISNDLTLVESVPLMSIHHKEHRELLLRNVHNDLVLDDWRMFEVSNNTQKQTLIEGAANRLRKFLNSEAIRNIVGQKDAVLDFSQAMEQGKIVLINLNGQGRISHENMKLLGIMIVNEIFRCAKLRDTRDRNLKPFYFYIDEFAQFVTRDIARSLEEARKFKLFMVLAHQHLAQLKREDEYLYASVLTNCRNKIVFGGLSREDAEVMAQEVATGFVDLNAIKDEIYTTKARQNLKKTEVRNWSEGQSQSTSEGETLGESQGVSEGHSESFTEGKSNSLGFGFGKNRSKNSSQTQTRGSSYTDSQSETVGQSTTQGQGVGYHPESDPSKAFFNNVTGHGPNASSFNQSSSNTNSRSQQRGFSNSNSESSGLTEGTSEGETENRTESSSTSRSTSRSDIRSTSRSESRSSSQSNTSGTSSSQGVSETWVNVAEEYHELSSRTFWSLNELEYMQMAELKNQGVAQAFVRLRSGKPTQVQIDRIDSVFYHNRTSEARIDRFKNKAIAANQYCYTPIEQVHQEREQRQIAAFGEPLNLDGTIIELAPDGAVDLAKSHDDDPFN